MGTERSASKGAVKWLTVWCIAYLLAHCFPVLFWTTLAAIVSVVILIISIL